MQELGSVNVQIVVTPAMLRQLLNVTEEGIQNAITRAIPRIEGVAMDNTPVGDPSNYGYTGGRVPGQLASSFQIARTPRSIVFKWTAPYKDVDYASIVEKGRQGWHPFPARNYAAATKQRAREILLEELLVEFSQIGS